MWQGVGPSTGSPWSQLLSFSQEKIEQLSFIYNQGGIIISGPDEI